MATTSKTEEYQNWLFEIMEQARVWTNELAKEALKQPRVKDAYKYVKENTPHSNEYGGTTRGAIVSLNACIMDDVRSIVAKKVGNIELHSQGSEKH